MSRLSFPALAVAALLAVGACSSGSSAAPPAASAGGASAGASAAASGQSGAVAATIKDFAFNPATIQAKVGQTIAWTNQDSTAHTVTLDDKSVDSGNVQANTTYSHAFTQAGTFTYHCAIHQQMKGTITVS